MTGKGMGCCVGYAGRGQGGRRGAQQGFGGYAGRGRGMGVGAGPYGRGFGRMNAAGFGSPDAVSEQEQLRAEERVLSRSLQEIRDRLSRFEPKSEA